MFVFDDLDVKLILASKHIIIEPLANLAGRHAFDRGFRQW